METFIDSVNIATRLNKGAQLKPIDELEGRELDAAVAKEVMRWDHSIAANFPWQMIPPGPRKYVDMTDVKQLSGPLVTEPIAEIRAVPHYSTDIAAAWTVVEKMAEDGLWLTLQSMWSGQTFTAVFRRGKDFAGESGIWCPAPEAICRAALAAVRA